MLGAAKQQPEDIGPPLASAPGQPPTTAMRRYDVERSCIRCHARKVRCDRATPCTTCVRARALCRYPGPERTKRRSQKGASAKVQEVVPRLEVLERAVAAIDSAGRSSPAPAPVSPGEAVRAGPDHRPDRNLLLDSEHSGGFLFKEGSCTRYINESTFSSILDKVGDGTSPNPAGAPQRIRATAWC